MSIALDVQFASNYLTNNAYLDFYTDCSSNRVGFFGVFMGLGLSGISVLVLGLGNLVMSDDAVGVIVAQRISERYRFPCSVEIIDGGTLGLDLLPKLENVSNLIIIDAVETGGETGTCVRLSGEEIPVALQTKISPHQMGLRDLLAVSELMGHLPEKMVMLGIQPGSIEMEVGLTPEIEVKVEHLVANVLKELDNWGVVSVPVQ